MSLVTSETSPATLSSGEPSENGTKSATSPRPFILTTACPDTTGIVAGISGFLASHNALITEAQHYDESAVLHRAIKWHAERRVFRNGNKTVVLR
jgi:formyltetrahydrofolate hydrolase